MIILYLLGIYLIGIFVASICTVYIENIIALEIRNQKYSVNISHDKLPSYDEVVYTV